MKNYSELKSKSLELKAAYDELNKKKGEKKWTYREYTEGLVGDVGDLVKLVMTKARFRGNPEGVDKEIEHELSDILWSIIIISEELNVELDEVFIKQIEELRSRVKAK